MEKEEAERVEQDDGGVATEMEWKKGRLVRGSVQSWGGCCGQSGGGGSDDKAGAADDC